MDPQPGPDQDDPERQADKQANVMKDQLRKEVALWNAERSDTSARAARSATMSICSAVASPGMPPIGLSEMVTIPWPGTLCGVTLVATKAAKRGSVAARRATVSESAGRGSSGGMAK